MYNLARIYYFGIEHKRKISKSISLLEQASKKQLYIADLFLFYIFSFCDDKNFLNQRKSHQYQFFWNILISSFSKINYFNNVHQNIQNLHIFLKDYDLIHRKDYMLDLSYFILSGICKMPNENSLYNKLINTISLKKDINDSFYEGFND